MLNVIILSVLMLNVVMLGVIMLGVVAPLQHNQIFAEEARDSPSVPHFDSLMS